MPDVYTWTSSSTSKSAHLPSTHRNHQATNPSTQVANLHLYKESTERLELIRSERHQIVIEDEPFASGGVCDAFRIWFIKSDGEKGPMQVAKRYKFKDGKQGFREDHVNWFWANILVDPFNALMGKTYPDIPLVKFQSCTRLMELNGEWYSIEDFLDGKFVKYNNIFGDVERLPVPGEEPAYCDLAAAFSHFSFYYSGHEFVVLDVQGVDSGYTDPAIVSRQQSKYGYTDTGLSGLTQFFKKHTCNGFCAKLGLKPVSHKALPAPTRAKGEVRIARNKSKYLAATMGKTHPTSFAVVGSSNAQVVHTSSHSSHPTSPPLTTTIAIPWDAQQGLVPWTQVFSPAPYYWAAVA